MDELSTTHLGVTRGEGRYRPDIDGLRAIAVAAVIMFHANVPGWRGGFVGVDIFFVISGYLIASMIASQQARGTFSLSRFYENRLRRIGPALITMLSGSAMLAYAVLPPVELRRFGRDLGANVVFASNILQWRTFGYFATEAQSQPLLHTWSLGVEEQFYLLFPLAFVWLLSRHRTRACWIVLGAAVASIVLAIVVAESGRHEAAFFLLPTRAWQLLIGVVISLTPSRIVLSRTTREVASTVALLGIVVGIALCDALDPYPSPLIALPTVGAAILIGANRDEPTLVARLLGSRPLVSLGLISYSLYLWHWPLFVFVRYVPLALSAHGEDAAVIVLSVILAVLSWRYVERPFRRMEPRMPRRIAIGTCVIAAAVIAAVAGSTFFMEGFPGRYQRRDLTYLREMSTERDSLAVTCTRDRLIAVPLSGVCQLGPAHAISEDLLVWGDSHATALLTVLAEEASDRGVSGTLAWRAGCPPLVGAGVAGEQDHECAQFNRAIMRLVHSGRYRNAVIVARWSYITNGSRTWDPRARFLWTLELDGKVPQSAEDNNVFFERALRRTVFALRAAGLQVFLVQDVPHYRKDVPTLLANADRYGIATATIGLDTTTHRAQQRRALEVFRELARTSGAVIVDSALPLCESLRCIVTLDSQPLYVDRDHLSRFGAEQLRGVVRAMFDKFQ